VSLTSVEYQSEENLLIPRLDFMVLMAMFEILKVKTREKAMRSRATQGHSCCFTSGH
jgi:hypothetical protein